jgi:arsenate reductase
VIQIFGHAKCKGTRAAQRFFAERRIKVQSVDILAKGLSKGELESVARAVGGVEALYDAQGARARDRGLPHAQPKGARITELLLEDPKLYRTPIVRDGSRATVGVDEAAWRAWLADDKQKE